MIWSFLSNIIRFQVKKKQFFRNFMTIMTFGAVGTLISFAIISLGKLPPEDFSFYSLGLCCKGLKMCGTLGVLGYKKIVGNNKSFKVWLGCEQASVFPVSKFLYVSALLVGWNLYWCNCSVNVIWYKCSLIIRFSFLLSVPIIQNHWELHF